MRNEILGITNVHVGLSLCQSNLNICHRLSPAGDQCTCDGRGMVTRAWSASDQSHCWRGAPACWSDRSTDDPGPGADESGVNKHKQASYLETIEVDQPPTLC